VKVGDVTQAIADRGGNLAVANVFAILVNQFKPEVLESMPLDWVRRLPLGSDEVERIRDACVALLEILDRLEQEAQDRRSSLAVVRGGGR
jgi:hypothetical protein